MQRVDINHDGVIQLTEFVAGLVDWKALQSDTQWGQWVQMAFDRLDGNGDGWLSLDELIEQLPADGSTDAGALLPMRVLLLLPGWCPAVFVCLWLAVLWMSRLVEQLPAHGSACAFALPGCFFVVG